MDDTLSKLFNEESDKCIGILNGIDDEYWDPKTDELIVHPKKGTWNEFKMQNKEAFAEEYGLDTTKPWISFIGRFSYQKGVDIIAPTVKEILKMKKSACFIVLGNGNKKLEEEIIALEKKKKVKTLIMYNEKIAHEIYAASDFILMPSRFEPCGLNQMFAMRYGTIPIVRATGGLKDTVKESEKSGTGFCFEKANAEDMTQAISRALETYYSGEAFQKLRARCTRQNFSWKKSAKEYIKEYKNLIT
jgi:starch synthase